MRTKSTVKLAISTFALCFGLAAESQDGLLAYYPFDDGSAVDIENGYDGLNVGAVRTEDRCGNPDKALLFDGVNDYVDISVISSGINRDENTFSMWVRPTVAKPYGCLYAQWHRHTICNDTARAVTGAGWDVWVPIPPGEDLYLFIDPPLQAGEWYHVALTFMGGDRAVLYVDGNMVDEGSYSTSYGLAFFTSYNYAKFSLGRLVDFGGSGVPSSRYYLSGALDDVRIHNRALSESEVLALAAPCEGSGDSDGDGVPDDLDVCPGFDDTIDSDSDGTPDGCDACPYDADNDADGDGVCGDVDLCLGDDASGDDDGDGLCNDSDPCFGASNSDADGDGVCDEGDLCYGDDATGNTDGDGVCDDLDVCVGDDDSGDSDGDGTCDDIDACPLDVENDADGDGVCEIEDNCPTDANFNQNDNDGDGAGDVCDDDDDNDNVLDEDDNCPLVANTGQEDFDGDGAGDVCDTDDDNDGVLDADDDCLTTAIGAVVNTDGCSIADLAPCDNNWKNHGAYVRAVTHTANDFRDLGLIGYTEHGDIVSEAAQSDCGHRN